MAFHHDHEETYGAGYTPDMRYLPQDKLDYIKRRDLVDQIDPLLQCHTLYSGSLYGTSGMQRYLQEPQSNFFTAPHQLPVQNTHYAGVYPKTSSYPHHNSHFRHGSPPCYQHSSSASGPQSPLLTDNDGHVEGTQGPSTPSDTAVLSPHIASLGSPSPSVSLYGISSAAQGCVNPAVIQPNHPLHSNHVEEELSVFPLDFHLDFGSTIPMSVFSNSDSSNELSTNAPDDIMESEDHIDVSYPEIDSMEVDIKAEDDTTDIGSSAAVDDDDEYKPGPRAKASRTPRGKSRRGRTTRSNHDTLATTACVTKPQRSPRAATNQNLLATSSGRRAVCTHCSMSFSDGVLLQKHMTATHNRPFICVFHFAGCNKVFANKNEWKRHVSAQHLNLTYWLCTSGGCGYSPNMSKRVSDTPTHCRVFRRKDLYTQHIRRMHAPPEVAQADKKDKSFSPDWIIQEKELQDKAIRQRCTLPVFMRCPAKGCLTVFDNGPRTWDNRMEHVAIHLEHVANGEEPPFGFGGDNDETLTEWASQSDVRVIKSTSTGWEICQPLKAARIEISQLSSLNEGLDEDAEGEEC
ncbi:c2h2 finger [Fusarium longipes]|uniref:C2h2 finger n=1 Tax=Fusarium longipes TaxID=694270 RepID=A0A395S6T3_9HYPO|nr:c2h2 finger [Fusarium longipes]